MLLSIFKKKEFLVPNLTPLIFSENSLIKINSHLEKLEFRSLFKIEVVRRKNLYQCNVGFDDKKFYTKTNFDYPTELILTKKDELFLRGCNLEYDLEKEQFFIYPNIEVQLDPFRKNFTRIYLNRNFISDKSIYRFVGIEKNQFHNLPFYIEKILMVDSIKSLYIEKNFISIEHESKFQNIENVLIDILFDYFSTCSYPILISDNKVELDFEI